MGDLWTDSHSHNFLHYDVGQEVVVSNNSNTSSDWKGTVVVIDEKIDRGKYDYRIENPGTEEHTMVQEWEIREV